VHYVDDHVTEADVTSLATHLQRAELTPEELACADAVVVLTDHDDVDYDMVGAHAHYVLDTRHRCRGDVVEYL
jgi:UDP-N-acetyl-D-mannosaminuronate dehydrogenase